MTNTRVRSTATAAALLVTASLAVAPPADAKAVAVSPGVSYSLQKWHPASKRPLQSGLLSVDLRNRHVHVDTYLVGNALNGGYAPVSAMLTRSGSHAVGAVNGGFFDLSHKTGVPEGGIVRGGRIIATPKARSQANFWIKANGTAGVGQVEFTGSIAIRPTLGTTAPITHTIHSVNEVWHAKLGRVTLLTHDLNGGRIPVGCAIAKLTTAMGVTTVTSSTVIKAAKPHAGDPWLARLATNHSAVLGCGRNVNWMTSQLAAGRRVDVRGYLSTGPTPAKVKPTVPVQTLVSGAEALILNGKKVNDTTAHNVTGLNSETFVCVMRDARRLILGTVNDLWHKGMHKQTTGLTMSQLRVYLAAKHCWNALALDGGGSTTVDYRKVHSKTVVHGNHPAYGPERKVPDGLVVSYG